MSNILEMKGIEKAFFGVTVLDKVDFPWSRERCTLSSAKTARESPRL